MIDQRVIMLEFDEQMKNQHWQRGCWLLADHRYCRAAVWLCVVTLPAWSQYVLYNLILSLFHTASGVSYKKHHQNLVNINKESMWCMSSWAIKHMYSMFLLQCRTISSWTSCFTGSINVSPPTSWNQSEVQLLPDCKQSCSEKSFWFSISLLLSPREALLSQSVTLATNGSSYAHRKMKTENNWNLSWFNWFPQQTPASKCFQQNQRNSQCR